MNPLKCVKLIALLFVGVLLFSRCSDSPEDQITPSDLKNGRIGKIGFQGVAFERLPDNSIGDRIADVMITFTKSDSTYTQTVYSDPNGAYRIPLPVGTYYVTASHPVYETYQSAPGYFVVTGEDGFQTGNFFLKKFATGFGGKTYEKVSNGIGPVVGGVTITFTKSDNSLVKTVVSSSYGAYKIGLPAGSYYVTASHPDYETYQSAPGVFVLTGTDGFQTGNFFLKPLNSGFKGVALEVGTNTRIPGLQITFTRKDDSISKTVVTDAKGVYKIALPPGGYYVVATHRLYETYQSSPGIFIVPSDSTYQTGNFFLTRIDDPLARRWR